MILKTHRRSLIKSTMADEKKPEAKPAPEPTSWLAHEDPFIELVWTLLAIFVIMYLLSWFTSAIRSGAPSIMGFNNIDYKSLLATLKWIFTIFQIVSVLVSALLIGWAVYLYRKISELRVEEAKKYSPPEVVSPDENAELHNPQWDRVLNHIESQNEGDWRLAILEGDIMLETLLSNMGLPGETVADKLKAVEKSDFNTIDNAWEAHKIRNQIAHEGGTFVISQHEAKRVVSLYRSVFEEFKII